MITKDIIEKITPGTWFREPDANWLVNHISENKLNCKKGETLFIAMDKETWLKGTGNTGIYANWDDTHELVHTFSDKVHGIIAQRPIPNLPEHIPQYISENPFDFINKYSEYTRCNIDSKIIAITGTVGKTSTKDYLSILLKEFGSTYATVKNHNSKTGVKITLANAMSNPDYLVIETAMAALWLKTGSISRLSRPDIAIITEVGVGQQGCDENKTADFKSRIADGLSENGLVIINRDIKNYAQLVKYVHRYSKNILSYGQHIDADIRFERVEDGFTVQLKEEKHHIHLDTYVDDGTLSNMTASLATLYTLGLKLTDVFQLYKKINNKESTLAVSYLKDKSVFLIDDTYNAEYLSMINAFKFCQGKYKDNRKILVIGDIINLANKSREVHESLVKPILESEFKLIATFGKDTIYLNQLLPSDRNLGHFTDAKQCAKQIRNILQENDVLLVKGSRRNSTIATIPSLITAPESASTQLNNNVNQYMVANLSHSNFSEEIWQTKTEYGIGSLILIYLALRKYALDEVQLNSIYKVTVNVNREAKGNNALGLFLGESYYFCQILQYAILTQKPDCILALAEHLYQTTGAALKEIKKEAEILGIDPNKILNVTGRNLRGVTQTKTFLEIFKVSKKIFELPAHFRNEFFVDITYFKGAILRPITAVASDVSLDGFLFVGDRSRRVYVGYSQQTHKKISIHYTDGENAKIEHILPYYQAFDELPDSKKINAKSPFINILGDTYFGESYTKIRKRRGAIDALQKYGYTHSFEKIAPFFAKDDINIANFEAVFTASDTEQSPLEKIKPFILGADAEKTLNEFLNRNINHVVLANNHLKDYGSESLEFTLDQFDKKSIAYIGAGRNQNQAHEYFEIDWKGKKLAIFNGYWHRDTAYNKFDFYALGHRDGVACTNGILLDQLKAYKTCFPQNKIMVISHWGVDFKPIQDEQTRIAKLLVSCGADLIIGHGPHTIQPIEYIDGKPIIYSIGNGVFNSNGEYERHQAMPYGCIVRLNMDEQTLKLYPIFTNNLKTFWQPQQVNKDQFLEIKTKILKNEIEVSNGEEDKLGYFFSITF